MVNWSEHTKRTLSFNCSNKTQGMTKACKTPVDEGQGAQACINDGYGAQARGHPRRAIQHTLENHGYVLMGDLRITTNSNLRKLVSKVPIFVKQCH